MDLHTALMLSAATVSAGGALIACIQAERATRAERAALSAYAATAAEAADARRTLTHAMNTLADAAMARDEAADYARRAEAAAATAPKLPAPEREPARGSPEYWEARHGVAMRDRHGRPVTVYYDGDDLITVKPHHQASERWHRLSVAALDLRLPNEPAPDSVPTALPPQGPGA